MTSTFRCSIAVVVALSALATVMLAACLPPPATSESDGGSSGTSVSGSAGATTGGTGGTGGAGGTIGGSGGSTTWPSEITVITAASGETVTTAGDLARGAEMPDLDWASSSEMACFPGAGEASFNGNHVLYAVLLPAHSKVTITAVPDDPLTDLSLYAYRIAASVHDVPPSIETSLGCESSYEPQNGNPGESESVTLVSVADPLNVVIGVAGVQGTSSGTYELKITITPY